MIRTVDFDIRGVPQGFNSNEDLRPTTEVAGSASETEPVSNFIWIQRPFVTDDGAFDEVDDVLGDVGGVVGNAFDVSRGGEKLNGRFDEVG